MSEAEAATDTAKRAREEEETPAAADGGKFLFCCDRYCCTSTVCAVEETPCLNLVCDGSLLISLVSLDCSFNFVR